MDQLGEQVTELLHRPQPVQPGPSALTDKLISDMSNKLDQICTKEPVLCLDSHLDESAEGASHRNSPSTSASTVRSFCSDG